MSYYNYMTIISGVSQCTMLAVALDYIHIWLRQRIGRDVISLSLIWDSFHFWGLRASETYAGEEQRPQGGIDNVQDLVTDEDAEDGEEQQDDQTHKQHSPAGSEVILALQ